MMPFRAVPAIACGIGVAAILGIAADEPHLKPRSPLPQNGVTEYRVDPGRRIPVKLLNTISIGADERLYLQTVFPVAVLDHAVIPAGTYIDGRVSGFRKAAHSKARIEMTLRLDRLSLPSGHEKLLQRCYGSMTVPVSMHGSESVIVPGTTSDIVLQDAIVFPIGPEAARP